MSEESLLGLINRSVPILKLAGLKGNKLILALDNIYKSRTGFSLFEVIGIHFDKVGDKKLLTPAKVGRALGIRNRRVATQVVNYLLGDNGYQYRTTYSWMPTDKGYPYAAICDTEEITSDGEVIHMLKWTEDIIPILKKILSDTVWR